MPCDLRRWEFFRLPAHTATRALPIDTWKCWADQRHARSRTRRPDHQKRCAAVAAVAHTLTVLMPVRPRPRRCVLLGCVRPAGLLPRRATDEQPLSGEPAEEVSTSRPSRSNGPRSYGRRLTRRDPQEKSQVIRQASTAPPQAERDRYVRDRLKRLPCALVSRVQPVLLSQSLR